MPRITCCARCPATQPPSAWPMTCSATITTCCTPTYRGGWQAPYRTVWTSVKPRHERGSLEGHQGAVYGVCPVTVAGRPLLASASGDGTVRIWDPAGGQQHVILDGHPSGVWAVCPVTVAGRPLLATADGDGTVRIWDPETGQQR